MGKTVFEQHTTKKAIWTAKKYTKIASFTHQRETKSKVSEAVSKWSQKEGQKQVTHRARGIYSSDSGAERQNDPAQHREETEMVTVSFATLPTQHLADKYLSQRNETTNA